MLDEFSKPKTIMEIADPSNLYGTITTLYL